MPSGILYKKGIVSRTIPQMPMILYVFLKSESTKIGSRSPLKGSARPRRINRSWPFRGFSSPNLADKDPPAWWIPSAPLHEGYSPGWTYQVELDWAYQVSPWKETIEEPFANAGRRNKDSSILNQQPNAIILECTLVILLAKNKDGISLWTN